MIAREAQLLAQATAAIQAMLEGRGAAGIGLAGDDAVELQAFVGALTQLQTQIDAVRTFSIALANGDLDAEAPPRLPMLAPMKALQASLRHLTWQTKEIAAGSFEHQVDFLGEFSIAFNQMIAALRDKRRAEQESMQASKLASIGQLAGGIAHEINTPLQYVTDNLRFLGDALPELVSAALAGDARAGSGGGLDALKQDLEAAVADASSGAVRVAGIVKALRDFAQPATTVATMTDLNKALDSTLTVTHSEWMDVAEIERRFAPDLPLVSCHPGEMNQVFLNLILNAAQAIKGSGKPSPGKIVITTGRQADQVCIRVADSGTGVPAAIRHQIFDPFFSTKPVGQGTGQGLAICRDVVEVKHKGRIEVGGEEGAGAVFTVWLPIAGWAAEESPASGCPVD